MSYDLRRLRLHGLISRVLASNTYVVTPEGTRVAVFCTKPHDRLLGPLLDADRPPAPVELRRALAPSSASWATTSTTLVSGQPPETCHKVQRLEHQQVLEVLP